MATGSAEKRGGSWWILLLLALAIATAMRLAAPSAIQAACAQFRLNGAAALAVLLAAGALSMIVHEAGHLTAALLLRFEVLGGSLGPFRIEKSGGRWRSHLTRGNLFKGSVAAVPSGGKPRRLATMIVVAAGPMATLAAGFASVFAVSQTGAHPFWGAMSELNLLLFALSLIPFQAKKAPSDAKLFLQLLRNGREAAEIARCFARMRERALTPADTGCTA